MFLSSCQTAQKIEEMDEIQMSKESIPWQREFIVERTLILQDKEIYERFGFGEQGFVSATIGTKNGPIAGPLWMWQIDQDGVLTISDSSESKILSLRLNRIESELAYTLTEDGKIRVYRIE